MDLFESDGLLENARALGPYMQSQLQSLADLPIVGDIRGHGLMGCLECVVSKESKQPLELDYAVGSRIDKYCQQLGLLVRPLINMCVMSPPLCITSEQIDDMVKILREGICRTMDDLEKEGVGRFS
jgi:adenosylmethionine-8-amino-7-oxononanoate aminotransferase